MGPGAGIQLKQGPHAGRLLYIGHFGAYVRDEVRHNCISSLPTAFLNGCVCRFGSLTTVE